MSEGERAEGGLNILCIDGGGVRELSSLLLLSHIMKKLQYLEGIHHPLDPADYFDVIAGTGTGGLVACMLGRLHMSLDEAIHAYTKLTEYVFSGATISGMAGYQKANLRRALKSMIKSATGHEDTMMKEKTRSLYGCQTMVFAMSDPNVSASTPIVFRSYEATNDPESDCTIWKALYTTMTQPDLFGVARTGDGIVGGLSIGNRLGYINPIMQVVAEVTNMHPNRHVSCVLSIGAEHTYTTCAPNPTQSRGEIRTDAMAVTNSNLTTTSEMVTEDTAPQTQDATGVYYRFNIDQEVQRMNVVTWEGMDKAKEQSSEYVRKACTSQGMDRATRAMRERGATMSVMCLDERLQTSLAKERLIIKRCPASTLRSEFTGSEDQIDQVSACIVGNTVIRRVCVVQGPSGAGRTQLALQTIKRKRDSWKYVLYIDASSKEAIETSLEEFARDKGDQSSASQLAVGQNTRSTRKSSARSSRAMVTPYPDPPRLMQSPYRAALSWLESCQEPWLLLFDSADDSTLDIHKYLPRCNHGSILITTRRVDLEVHTYELIGSRCNCPGLATTYADRLAPVSEWTLKQPEDQGITKSLYSSPHVLNAGNYLLREDYPHGQTWGDDLKWPPQDQWNEAAPLRMQVIDVGVPGQYHPELLSSLNDLALACQNQSQLDKAESVQVQILNLNKTIHGEYHTDTLSAMSSLALTYQNQGRWDKAEQIQMQVLVARKRFLGEEHPHTLTSMKNLSWTYRNQGQWDKAELIQMQVFDAHKRALGEGHSQTLTSMNDLLLTYRNQGRCDEAEPMQVQVFELNKQLRGENHPQTLSSMCDLALTYQNQGRWDEAESIQLQVVAARMQILGEDHPDTLSIMNNLASTHQNQGQWERAELLQLQVLNAHKRVLGKMHIDTLVSMNNLASTYRNQGQWDKAESLQVQALNTCKQIFGKEHPRTLASMGTLASMYHGQRRWSEAESMQVQVLNVRKRILGEAHSDTLNSMSKLAHIYADQGQWIQAKTLQVQVLRAQKRVLGEDHPSTLTTMGNLSRTYSGLGRLGSAATLQERLLSALKRLLGEAHPDTLTAKSNLSQTYSKNKQWNKAEPLQLYVTDHLKYMLGDEHLDTLTSIGNLAQIYSNLGQWDQVETLQTQILAVTQRCLGKNHPKSLKAMVNLAHVQSKKGCYIHAEQLWADIVSLAKQELGHEDPETIVAIKHLANTHQALGHLSQAESLLVPLLSTSRRVLGNDHPRTLAIMNNIREIYKQMITQAAPTYFDRPNHMESVDLDCFDSLAETNFEVCNPSSTLPTGNGITISSSMSPEEIILKLSSTTCRNITNLLDEQSCDSMPTFHGGFGNVYYGRLTDETSVAVKCVRMPSQRAARNHTYAARELDIWSRLKHENILELLGLALFRRQIAMVSPWMDNGNLNDYLQSNPGADRCRICTQITRGLAYMHDNNAIHGDLKANNVFISKDGVAKIGDFGSAWRNDTMMYFSTTTARDNTLRWAAPELLLEKCLPTSESDVYALGMTILEVLSGKVPYSGIYELAVVQIVMQGQKKPARPDSISTQSEHGDLLWNLLLTTWDCCSNKRPSAKEIWGKIRHITPNSLKPKS